MKFKLAILNVLAKSPGRHLTLDELRREAELLAASEGQTEQLKRFSALGDIDILQSGLVLESDAGFQITDAGRSLLHSLESASEPSVKVSSDTSGLQFIDHLVGAEERLRIFDLELREVDRGPDEGADFDPDQSEQETEDESGATGIPDAASGGGDAEPRESIDASILDGTGESNRLPPSPVEEDQAIAIEPADVALRGAPEFLQRSFGSRGQAPSRSTHRRSDIFAYVAAKMRFMSAPWRRHLAQGTPNPKPEQLVGRVGGAAFALLSLVVVATCAGAAIAFVQINSLKSEIAALHRELQPLRERLGKLEQVEKTKRDLGQQEEEQSKSDAEKNKPGGEIRSDQTALNLSREEIQLIKEYIKPAPSPGLAAPAINVGDPVEGAMIPLPSQLTEKLPKLLGARFTTRNGAIIIVRRDSRQADAVLAPN